MPRKIRQIRIEGDVAYVPLTQGYEAIIDAADVPLVEGLNWHAVVKRRKDGFILATYAASKIMRSGKRTTSYMHRIISDPPQKLFTDHKDGNGLNNCRRNLRHATREQNARNSQGRGDNTSGFKGVSMHSRDGNWQAYIKVCGKQKHLGYFDAPEEAAAAYAEASNKFHGKFGRTE